jgi:hypothetical protein
MAVCCQNLPLGALSSPSTRSLLVGALFAKFRLFLNTGVCTAGLNVETRGLKLNSTQDKQIIFTLNADRTSI